MPLRFYRSAHCGHALGRPQRPLRLWFEPIWEVPQ